MSKPITDEAVRPDVQSDAFSIIPFGPSVRGLKPGTLKTLAAAARASWVQDGRRITLASNRELADLVAVADPETIGRHIRELAEAGVITIDGHEGRRRLTLPVVQPGEFVTLDNADPAWNLNAAPFAAFLAVRSFDWTSRGQVWPTDATLAQSLGWTVRAVKRCMGVLRRVGAVATSSRYDPRRRIRKRVVTIAGKVVLLCDGEHSRKSCPHLSGKVVPAHPEKWSSPIRKSGPLNQSLERERERKTEPTNPDPVGGRPPLTLIRDPKPRSDAGSVIPDDMAEVVALLAMSKLSHDEQGRYLTIARRMAEMEDPPPVAWHRYVLDVEPNGGTRSIAGVVIARLKAWSTTPPKSRDAIIEEIARRAEEKAQPSKLKEYEARYATTCLLLERGESTVDEARAYYVKVSEARKAAGLSPILIDARIIRAEREMNAKNAATNASPAITPPRPLTIDDFMAEQAKSKLVAGSATAALRPIDQADPEYRRHGLAETQQCERITFEAEQAEEIDRRIQAYQQRALMVLSMNTSGTLNDALTEFRTVTLPAKRAEIEAEVLARSAPNPARYKTTAIPTGRFPGTIPARLSRWFLRTVPPQGV